MSDLSICSIQHSVLLQPILGKIIIQNLSLEDRWSCVQVLPSWKDLMPTPLMLTARSRANIHRLAAQLTSEDGECSACVWDIDAFALLCEIAESYTFRVINLVILDVSKQTMPIRDLLRLFRIASANGESPFLSLKLLVATLTQQNYPVDGEKWIAELRLLIPPHLESAEACIVPNIQMNSSYFGEFMHLVSGTSRLTLRDRDNYIVNTNDSWYTWYNEKKFPNIYPNLIYLKVTVFSELINVLVRSRSGGFKAWFPVLKKLTLHAHGNFIRRSDLEKYKELFEGIEVAVDKNTRFLDEGPNWSGMSLG